MMRRFFTWLFSSLTDPMVIPPFPPPIPGDTHSVKAPAEDVARASKTMAVVYWQCGETEKAARCVFEWAGFTREVTEAPHA